MTFVGTYTCTAINRGGFDNMDIEVMVQEQHVDHGKLLGVSVAIIAVIVLLFLAFFSYHR